MKITVPDHDDLLVVSGIMVNFEVKRIFVDQGSSTDIIFGDLFEKLGFKRKELIPHHGYLMGFKGERIIPRGYVELRLTIGSPPLSKTVKVKCLVVDCPSAYNVIIGQPTLNALGAIVSTPHLAMKLITEERKLYNVRGEQVEARKCYKTASTHPKSWDLAGTSASGKSKKVKRHTDKATGENRISKVYPTYPLSPCSNEKNVLKKNLSMEKDLLDFRSV